MNFTDESIQEFINIWERECGELLTMDEAYAEANRLMDLAWFLAQPLPGEPGYQEPTRPDQM